MRSGPPATTTTSGARNKEWREYVHPDALGSTIAVTDDVKGRTRFDSEPFGKRIQPSGAAFAGSTPNVQAGFTGHHMDDDLALVNMKGRIFDPAQRRFISPDPLVARPMNAQSYNRYSYVYNNPLNLTDPSGFCGRGGEEKCPDVDPKTTSCIDNPYADGCGPGSDDPPPSGSQPDREAAPLHGRPDSVPSPGAYNGVHVPVLDAVVSSDAMGAKEPIDRNGGKFRDVSVYTPQLSDSTIVWNIVRNNFPPVDWVRAAIEPVYTATSDWIEDAHPYGSHIHNDHSGAMTSAVGGAALPFLIPGEGMVAGALSEITAGNQVTEQMIRAAMKDAPLHSQQAGGISLRLVQEYVDKLIAGEVAPAIQVDGSIIVNGNHRYVSGRVFGLEPDVREYLGARGPVVPWSEIKISTEW